MQRREVIFGLKGRFCQPRTRQPGDLRPVLGRRRLLAAQPSATRQGVSRSRATHRWSAMDWYVRSSV